MKNIFFIIFYIGFRYLSAQMDYSPGFDAGQPTEMKALSMLKGDWEIDLFYPLDPKSETAQWKAWSKSQSNIESVFDESYFLETSMGFPIYGGHEGYSRWEYKATFSYDRFRNIYRVSYIDNILGLLDVYEGVFEGDTLVLTNFNTNTFNNLGTDGSPQINRISIFNIDDNSFSLIWEIADKPKEASLSQKDVNWEWSVLMKYKKKG